MKKVELYCGAKLNLTLETLFRRSDGYHELAMVMHGIDLYDRMSLEKTDDDEIHFECSEPLPHDNTVRRAAAAFKAETGCGGVRIYLEKRIPSEAGLGGASADAAGTLRGMERLYGKIDEKRLYFLGKQVGADVPFCLHGGCALVGGIGEKLETLPSLDMSVLVVKGERGVSTSALFRSLDADALDGNRRHSLSMKEAILTGDTGAVPKLLYNDLSPAAEALVPEITEAREKLISLGALGACMTGSGSAVFGVFPDIESAKKAAEAFEGRFFTAACKTTERTIFAAP
ncbi:MAG: 4-(cytidine 5'-diphospho)-2-C-methyl-D-erythritol kinase [Clostridia bacterium]|nr:4-(cytidine 5'-diphospho)-2-C-methyl-D-erythritol kinase [Clostridia bacterium]